MSFELPIFPLNTVLFPGMPLPLHIFEPRYRAMIRRCLKSDRTFGVALALSERDGTPLPADIGCSAFILEDSPFTDGRLNIQTEGQQRFRILSLREEDDYLVAQAEWLDDVEDEDVEDLAHRVRVSLLAYLGLMKARDDEMFTLADLPDDAASLSYWVATLLSLPDAQKQELLEEDVLSQRLQAELTLLERARAVHQAFRRRTHVTAGNDDEAPTYLWFN